MNYAVPLHIPCKALVEFCRRYQVCELALFGSMLRQEPRPDSDVDLRVSFAPAAVPSASEVSQIQRLTPQVTHHFAARLTARIPAPALAPGRSTGYCRPLWTQQEGPFVLPLRRKIVPYLRCYALFSPPQQGIIGYYREGVPI
jgi:predicted nucleotidyltransferase